jgi:hypothetical protein
MKSRLLLFVMGFILGTLTIGVLAQNRVLPQYLVYGRTSLGINVPVLVDSMGIVQTHANP